MSEQMVEPGGQVAAPAAAEPAAAAPPPAPPDETLGWAEIDELAQEYADQLIREQIGPLLQQHGIDLSVLNGGQAEAPLDAETEQAVRSLVTTWEAEHGSDTLDFEEVMSRAKQVYLAGGGDPVESVHRAAESLAEENVGWGKIDAQLQLEHARFGEFDDKQVLELAQKVLPKLLERMDPAAAARSAIAAAAQQYAGERGTRAGDALRYHTGLAQLREPEPVNRRQFGTGRPGSMEQAMGDVNAKYAPLIRAEAKRAGR